MNSRQDVCRLPLNDGLLPLAASVVGLKTLNAATTFKLLTSLEDERGLTPLSWDQMNISKLAHGLLHGREGEFGTSSGLAEEGRWGRMVLADNEVRATFFGLSLASS